MGDRKIHALSEIEVWSDGKNLAKGTPVTRDHGDDQAIQVTDADRRLQLGKANHPRRQSGSANSPSAAGSNVNSQR